MFFAWCIFLAFVAEVVFIGILDSYDPEGVLEGAVMGVAHIVCFIMAMSLVYVGVIG